MQRIHPIFSCGRIHRHQKTAPFVRSTPLGISNSGAQRLQPGQAPTTAGRLGQCHGKEVYSGLGW